ncbi:MAG TPA: LLM class flavin-dependent oxidoreductase [Woeseiaceae bacterium]|nr:LLM class flavin-dependent oxidoreductase [Woeseiaceae bacterium]
MEFHIGILPRDAVDRSLEIGRAADELGFAGVWIADSHSIMRDPYAILNLLALQTGHIKLATGVTPTGTRHPAAIANGMATLDEVSGGRAILGLGTGDSAVVNLGLKPEKLAAFEEKMQVIRGLMRGDEVDYRGSKLRMPWSRRDVPIVMACSGPKALELGGRIADGVLFQVGADAAFVRYALDHIRKGAESAGRPPEDVTLYMRLACAVHKDGEKARDEVRGYASVAAGTVFRTIPPAYFDEELKADVERFKSGYEYLEHGSNASRQAALLTDRMLDAIAVAGTPEEVVSRFRELRAIGIERFVCPFSMRDPRSWMTSLAEDVVPRIAT